MTIIQTRADLLPLTYLNVGNHRSPEIGTCLLEAVAYVAGEPHSAHPRCACPVLCAFGRSINDVLPDDKRQRLIPLVPRIVGTAGDGHQQGRGLMAADWLIRVYTPTWLRLAGLTAEAESLEGLPRQATWDDVEAAVPTLQVAKNEAIAAYSAAHSAADSAAHSAARSAADSALHPAVDALQDSAIDLYTRMVEVGR